MTLVLLVGHAWSEAVRHHIEVVHRELIVEHIPILLRGRPAALLTASAVHPGGIGGVGRECECAAAAAYTAPCRTLLWAVPCRGAVQRLPITVSERRVSGLCRVVWVEAR